MTQICKYIFFQFFVRPAILIIFGLNIRHRERLPKKGPIIIVPNHNSHLDTMVLMCLFPWKTLKKVRPVGAHDYWLKNKFLSWLSKDIIGMIPIKRSGDPKKNDPFVYCHEALKNNDILIIYPEGSRGKAEELTELKSGIWHLIKKHPDVPVIPVFMHGLGKSLPRGKHIPIPFFCDIFIGEELPFNKDKCEYINELTNRINKLSKEGCFPTWE